MEELGIELPAKHSISAYSGCLRAAGMLSRQDAKDVEQMGGLRNDAAHGEFEAMVRQMPAGYALVLRGGLSPVICRVPVAWRNWRYLLARLRGRHIATVQAAPTVLSTEPLAEPEPVAPGPATWPGGEIRAAPVRPGAQHPWDVAAGGNGPNGHGADGKGGDAGGGHDDL